MKKALSLTVLGLVVAIMAAVLISQVSEPAMAIPCCSVCRERTISCTRGCDGDLDCLINCVGGTCPGGCSRTC